MVNPTEREQVGGEAVHIRDCRVWAEIYYLDSSTDYREYLPGNRDRLPTRSYDDLIRPDFSRPWLGLRPQTRLWLGGARFSSLDSLAILVFCFTAVQIGLGRVLVRLKTKVVDLSC